MKFLSFKAGGKNSYGALVGDDGVYDLGKRFGKKYPSLRWALKANKLNELRKAAQGKKPDLKLSRVTLRPPIPNLGSKVICVGLNYREHQQETGRSPTDHPTLFVRFPNSQMAHGQPIVLPPESDKLDWEGELAVVIGRGGRRITRDKAMSHVAGYACYNDATIRDWQRHTTQFTPGKNFPSTGGFGPYLVTPDEVGDITKQTLTTRVNGVVKQKATIDLMIFDIPALITYISTFTELVGGDIIVTGTPGGVGYARTPQEFMKAGDVCEVEITKVGLLRNPVKAE